MHLQAGGGHVALIVPINVHRQKFPRRPGQFAQFNQRRPAVGFRRAICRTIDQSLDGVLGTVEILCHPQHNKFILALDREIHVGVVVEKLRLVHQVMRAAKKQLRFRQDLLDLLRLAQVRADRRGGHFMHHQIGRKRLHACEVNLLAHFFRNGVDHQNFEAIFLQQRGAIGEIERERHVGRNGQFKVRPPAAGAHADVPGFAPGRVPQKNLPGGSAPQMVMARNHRAILSHPQTVSSSFVNHLF